MRRWLWPPSRVRASWPSSSSNCVPQRISSSICAGRLADDQLDDGAVAQAAAGGERVLDVVLEAVLRRQHAGDAALGVGAVALLDAVLGDDQDVAGRRAPPGRPAARRCRRR